MATQAQLNHLRQQKLGIQTELTKTLNQISKIRKLNVEQHKEKTILENKLKASELLRTTIKDEADKANLLLKMSQGQIKQYERDTCTTRKIYNDVIEDMINRQVMMAAAGWDEYIARKKRRKESNES